MNLKHELESEIVKYGFVQSSALNSLITEDSVRAYFRKKHLCAADIQGITSKAPRLFALLVLLGRGNAIEKCLSSDFVDEIFPLLDTASVPNICHINKQELYTRQWQIPIILPRARHLDLPHDFIPPFLEEKQISHGTFGFVSRVKLASGHLTGYDSVRLLTV